MVKHGRDKKRRAGRIGRTKLKNRSWNRWDPKPTISDTIIKANWDASKSPTANLSSMGLVAKPNVLSKPSSMHSKDDQTVTSGVRCIIDLYDVPESDTPRSKRFPLDKEDEEYIVRCMNKYGTDYKAMFRDIKTNNMQHTEEKLQKLCARYLLLTPDQRRLEVPERIKPLLAFP